MVIYYKEEKKELIIPSGFEYNGCGGSDCRDEIEQAYQSGWTNGYNAGLEACEGKPQSTAIVVYNNIDPIPYAGWVAASGRDLLLDGVSYAATPEGTIYGGMCQFNLETLPSATPSSITFTIDCRRSQEADGGPDVTALYIFDENVENYTQTKVVTTPQGDPNIYIGVTYTLTIDNQ